MNKDIIREGSRLYTNCVVNWRKNGIDNIGKLKFTCTCERRIGRDSSTQGIIYEKKLVSCKKSKEKGLGPGTD